MVMDAKVLLLLLVSFLVLGELGHHVRAFVPNTHGPSPISRWQETEMRQRMIACYQDIDNGLWGAACKVSTIDKENCAMRCTSQACYDVTYGADPLEEGELDLKRGRDYRFCVRREARSDQSRKEASFGLH